jgi:hypothetical protein
MNMIYFSFESGFVGISTSKQRIYFVRNKHFEGRVDK